MRIENRLIDNRGKILDLLRSKSIIYGLSVNLDL
jgi:hypothetical protein